MLTGKKRYLYAQLYHSLAREPRPSGRGGCQVIQSLLDFAPLQRPQAGTRFSVTVNPPCDLGIT
jgi:hypothetical protein